MRDTHTEAETEAEGEAGFPQEPNVGLDPGSWDHALSQRQMLNRWATQASQLVRFWIKYFFVLYELFCLKHLIVL